MITGEIKSQVDKVWNTFWSGGISNPLEVIEQITYLLFLKRLDENHTREEKRANLLGQPLQNAVFPDGLDPQGRPYSDLRWSKFKDFSQSEMFTVFSQSIFPFLRNELPKQSNGEDSTYSNHMKDAQFKIPNAGVLKQVVWLGPQIEVQCLCEFRVREWTQEEIHESWHADTPLSRSSPRSGRARRCSMTGARWSR
ncbi:hypothetical protein QF031_004248 [Pseudarthrobacter defluvii]|uniref:type I restriction-modification system subunit M N-terminal domain-containing protein n=1 Tax=Pseudarthrobacter defluvii TaxID=410837 RepID=UPI002781DBFD|nr:type I restriction-modification system subunit M N-terminal domain-containing protein [Pseudarthrobacter defluvii]MDQ0771499.1 hypothetical protein [Pseudarthrobacter defluvii]